jgi:hypothetical protein
MGGDAEEWLCAGAICDRRARERVCENATSAKRSSLGHVSTRRFGLCFCQSAVYANLLCATSSLQAKSVPWKYSHAQLSPKSGNWRHRAREHAVKKLTAR